MSETSGSSSPKVSLWLDFDLVLVGGGAAMRNLPEFLSDALGIPVRRASDYLNRSTCRVSYEAQQPERFDDYALAIGLATTP